MRRLLLVLAASLAMLGCEKSAQEKVAEHQLREIEARLERRDPQRWAAELRDWEAERRRREAEQQAIAQQLTNECQEVWLGVVSMNEKCKIQIEKARTKLGLLDVAA